MRLSALTFCCAAGLALTGCARQDTNAHRNEPAARELGREAHHAADDIKRGADKAAQEARRAGKNFREGWQEAKHDPPPPPPHPRDRRPDR